MKQDEITLLSKLSCLLRYVTILFYEQLFFWLLFGNAVKLKCSCHKFKSLVLMMPIQSSCQLDFFTNPFFNDSLSDQISEIFSFRSYTMTSRKITF